MKIFSKCQKCTEEIQSSTLCDTRGEYAMKKGDSVEVKCKICNFQNNIHIDEFTARESRTLKRLATTILVAGISICAIIFLWLMYEKGVLVIYFGMFGIPVFIYGALVKYDQSRVSNFNSLFAKR